MTLEVTGKLIEKYDTITVSERFRKREFVLELSDEVNGSIYTNFAKMQLVQNKCDILDRFQVGEVLKVSFGIKGTKYEKDGKVNYFSNLDAWRIENAAAAQGQNNAPQQGGYQQQQPQGGGYNNGNNFGGQPQPSFNPSSAPVSQDTPDDLPF